ncbi:ABC-F family ATP-binding cassette domain-containing protein [Ktedonosporobacter rubrisoli]|uniref:ABC-F family ATP-binding cassette domain-containing protein n=1 Tax=Ktedonosporobacter rubrisoli TaxID=2509675 RepID=A0A4V0Z010_KTERU|nr:ABC-F family ATP-binding cassette domain-containing protein [Ktedonosporobacter rubrisoli]QBD81591.1 ABC-F family ATP-binding cassette domain-containing protein [Ktedonosporobacter rubrisoli]
MLQVNHISLSYGARLVLDDISFTVAPGEKAGLIGVNGAGKSTLMKIIAGVQETDQGTVSLPRSHGYLSQDIAHEAPVEEGGSVRNFIFSSTGLDQAISKYEDLSARMAESANGDLSTLLQRFSQAQDELERLGYYEADARSEQLIAGLNLGGITLDRQVSTLSGGQKTKLALVRLLFQAPDLLLLDEPTNFLDIEATEWLMDFLQGYPGALLLISHDLDLLDSSISKILRINEFTHQLEEYRGNYSNYLTITGNTLAFIERTKRQHEREISRLRKTSDKLRGFGASRVSQRISIDKRIAQLEASKPQLPQESRRIKIDFPLRQPSGRLVLHADKLSKSYGSKEIFRNLSFQVERGQRLVIVGLNGAGKTTLLRTLLGLTPLNGGTVTFDERVHLGYYAQENEGLDYDNIVLEEASAVLPSDAKRVRGILGRFLFNGERVRQRVATLSGGEKTRLALAKMVLDGPNLLVLDEPTTHLDVISRNLIGDALGSYHGTIIAVTHDLEFVQHLKPDMLLLMPEGRTLLYDPKYNKLLTRA